MGGQNNIYQWKKNGLAIIGANEDSFVIPSVTASDAGTYALEISNSTVPGLTLESEPVIVSVLPIVDFSTELLTVHLVPPIVGAASGEATARLVGSVLTVSGEFEGLTGAFDRAAIHIGATDANTAPAFELSPAGDGQAGSFLDSENTFRLSNEQIIALQNGLFYIEIRTNDGGGANQTRAELRGQLYVEPNFAPSEPVLSAPEDGLEIDLGLPGELTVTWEGSEDLQGHPVHYFWAISREPDFEENAALIDRITRVDDETTITVSHENLDAFLAQNGVDQGQSVTFYHLVSASDGSLLAASDVRSVTLKRGTTNQSPFVADGIEDFSYLLDNGVFKLDLKSVFQDPDGDDLSLSALASDENIALVSIDADSLVITPLSVGDVTITVTASDETGETADDSFVLTLNQAPQVVNPIDDLTFVEGDDAFIQDLTTVFFDADPISFTAESENEAVATAMLDAAGTELTVAPVAVGATTITIVAMDDNDGVTPTVVQVIVQPDVISPPQSLSENVSITFGNPDLETSYRLVGLPGEVNLDIGDAIDGTHEEDWIAYRDTGGEGEREQFFVQYDGSAAFNFVPGRGFWLLSKNTWNRTDTRATVPLQEDGTYSIPLQNGWNIISNPFEIDIPWQAVMQTNDVSQSLHRWTGQFAQTNTFTSARSGEAFYYFNFEGLNQLNIPYLPNATGEAPIEKLPALSLTAQTTDKTISTVRFGLHAEARHGEDRFDQIAPPGTFESASLRLIQPDAPLKSRKRLLIEQFEPEGRQGYRYEITLRAPVNEPVKISLEDLDLVEVKKEIVLFDKTLAKRYDLHVDPSFTVWPELPEQNFVLLIGDDAYISLEAREILPSEVALLPNYPNPFDQQTTIEFALPEPSTVRLVVYDTLGRLVRILKDGALDAGHHSVVWDGRNDAGATLGSGLYFFQLLLPDSRLVQSAIVRH